MIRRYGDWERERLGIEYFFIWFSLEPLTPRNLAPWFFDEHYFDRISWFG